MYSLLVDDNSVHKKAKSVNKIEYEDVLLNNKCLRNSVDRIQSKNHRIGPYEIKKIFLLSFVEKIYILSNGYDGLALGYQA